MNNDPRKVAVSLLGNIEWRDAVSGYCNCPGAARHTHPTRKRDCSIHLNGAPTIHCFHHSCSSEVAGANLQLRRALARGTPGTLLGRPLAAPAVDPEKEVLAGISRLITARKESILANHWWPYATILGGSPHPVAAMSPDQQFLAWLALWPYDAQVWIGNIYNSGRPEYRKHFRPASCWALLGRTANYTCGSSFHPGAFRRGNNEVATRHFLVVESDILSRDDVGAVFNYMQQELGYRLHCIIDTGGKSLHGWFDAPENKRAEQRLKAVLTALDCDPKMFNHSQPVRVPGAWRGDRLQRLIWLRAGVTPLTSPTMP